MEEQIRREARAEGLGCLLIVFSSFAIFCILLKEIILICASLKS